MFGCITVTSLALLWLFYESDWLRLRMLVGPVATFCEWSPPRDYILEAIQLVTQHEVDATNAIKRATAETERDILSLIECASSPADVLEWSRMEIDKIEKEFGDRLCPYRNSSVRGHRGGHDRNPYAYPFYGVTAAELDARYDTYLQFAEKLAFRMEEVA